MIRQIRPARRPTPPDRSGQSPRLAFSLRAMGLLALSWLGSCGPAEEGAPGGVENAGTPQPSRTETERVSAAGVQERPELAPSAVPLQQSPALVPFQEARTLARAKRFEEAEARLREALELDPDQDDVALFLGQILIERSDVLVGYTTTDLELARQGIALIEAVAAKRPSDLGTQMILGQAYMRAKDYERARTVLEGCLALDPGNPIASESLANIRFQAGESKEARALLAPLTSGAGVRPSVNLLLLWGQVNEDCEDLVTAERAYERAIALAPGDYKASFLYASLLAKLGRKEDADREFAVYQKILQRKGKAKRAEEKAAEAGTDANLWLLAGIARVEVSELEEAEENLWRAYALDANDPSIQYWIGYVLYSRQAFAEAKDHLEFAARAASDTPEPHRYLGECLLALGDAQGAVAELEEAHRLREEDDDIRAALERARSLAAKKVGDG